MARVHAALLLAVRTDRRKHTKQSSLKIFCECRMKNEMDASLPRVGKRYISFSFREQRYVGYKWTKIIRGDFNDFGTSVDLSADGFCPSLLVRGTQVAALRQVIFIFYALTALTGFKWAKNVRETFQAIALTQW